MSKEFKKIASFTINHNTLEKGMYISRIDDDIITYDLRMKKPNNEYNDYLDNNALHTFEHLFATYVRNTEYSDKIIYVGPMGCRTGFYFIVRDSLPHNIAIRLVKETMDFILDFEGEIPGSKKEECGNYLAHSLEGAKEISKEMKAVLSSWTEADLLYPE